MIAARSSPDGEVIEALPSRLDIGFILHSWVRLDRPLLMAGYPDGRPGRRPHPAGLVFEDAGEHQLKGLPDQWRLYRVVAWLW